MTRMTGLGLEFEQTSRKNRVNQSGSVALSAEEVQGPPRRK